VTIRFVGPLATLLRNTALSDSLATVMEKSGLPCEGKGEGEERGAASSYDLTEPVPP